MNVSLERSLFEIAGQHFSKCVEEGLYACCRQSESAHSADTQEIRLS